MEIPLEIPFFARSKFSFQQREPQMTFLKHQVDTFEAQFGRPKNSSSNCKLQ